jgi:hypothetical protein
MTKNSDIYQCFVHVKIKLSAMIVATMCFSSVQAEVITSIDSGATPLGMSTVNYFGAGPVSENGFTWTSTAPYSVYGYDGGYGLANNGSWNNFTHVGLNNSNGSMRFTFDNPVSQVVAFVNYAPGYGTATISIYDASGNLIESTNLNIDTPSGNNAGETYGFKHASATIKYFELSNAYIVANDIRVFFGLAGPSAIDTLASMQRNASSMRGFFSLQASYVNPGLSYDCAIFDDNGYCFSMTARNTSVGGSDINSSSGVVTAAYRVNSNVRLGGFIEQMTSNIKDGGIRLDNNSPDYGVFGVWQQNEDGAGLKARAAFRYGRKDLDITRQAVGSAEAGFGESDLTTQGMQFTLSNGFRVHEQVLLSPYAGIRYINIKRDGYTEDLTATVTAPLSYDNLRQESTSALLGASLYAQLTPRVIASGSLGLEHDITRKIGNYSATGIDNLESIKFNEDSKRTRLVASLGLGFRIQQAQQLSAQVVYREEAYGDKSTTTAMLTYTAGF